MFEQLKKILRKGDTVTMTVAVENDTQLRVSVFPKLFTLDGERGENRQALNTPLSIVATPPELDSPMFIETLEKFAGSTNVLRHTLEEVEAEHKKAAEAAKSKGKGTAPAAPPSAAAKKSHHKAKPSGADGGAGVSPAVSAVSPEATASPVAPAAPAPAPGPTPADLSRRSEAKAEDRIEELGI